MMVTRSADEVLNDSFLEVRARLLEIAAALDRVDRSIAEGDPLRGDELARRQRIGEAISLLLDAETASDASAGQGTTESGGTTPGRAEKLQRLFSREYQPDWRTTMSL